MRILLLSLLLAAAGCASKPPPGDVDRFLEDAVGDASAPRFDIVRANLTELNGSLAVRIEIATFQGGMPLVEARLATGHGDHWARLSFDPSRPSAPRVKAEQGRWEGGERRGAAVACWFPSFPASEASPEPRWIFLEFLHNRTGLGAGGEVRGLTLTTMDLNDDGTPGPIEDEASAQATVPVRGGANPHAPDCPLIRERSRLV